MSAEINREIPFIRGPCGRRLTRSETETALALADAVIRWAASVDPDRWSETSEKWAAVVADKKGALAPERKNK
jgi:hypothetical protein